MTELISNNKLTFAGMLAGCILGGIHWYYFGYSWGIYPFSSELWMNISLGTLAGGFVTSLFQKS